MELEKGGVKGKNKPLIQLCTSKEKQKMPQYTDYEKKAGVTNFVVFIHYSG